MKTGRQIGVIAPDPLLGAFSVLIQSAPQLTLAAAEQDLAGFQARQGRQGLDVVLIYLAQDIGANGSLPAYDQIQQIKIAWPQVVCVTIVKYPEQAEPAQAAGADIVLVEGVSADHLLAALDVSL